MLSMVTRIIEGKDDLSQHEFDAYPVRAENVDYDHDTTVESFHEDVID